MWRERVGACLSSVMENEFGPRIATTRRTPRSLLGVTLLALVAVLAACGGSSSGSDDGATDATLAKPKPAREQTARPDPDAVLARSVTADLAGTNGPFPTFDDSAGSGYYGNGVYTLVSKPADSKTVSGFGQEDFGGNASVSATIDSSGAPTDSGFGLVCRMQDGENYYRFGIGNDGTYSIAVVEDNEATLLTSDDGFWSDSDLVDEAARTFDIEARCDGDTLELSVDDEVVDSVTDDTYASGSVGVFSATFDEPNASIAVTSFAASGIIDDDAVSNEAYSAWSRFYRSTPAEVTRCDLVDSAASGLRPVPLFVTLCNGVQYAQLADSDEAEDVFGAFVADAASGDVDSAREFPDCRTETDVVGPLPESVDLPVSGEVACIDRGDSIAVIWWNDAGIVGAYQVAPDDPSFVADWAPGWWPFTSVQKPGGEE